MSSPRRPLFVVNRHAAAGSTGTFWTALEPNVENCFPEVEVCFTAGPGDATRLAREGIEAGHDLVVSVGGDGTHHEVVNGFFDETGNSIGQAAFGIVSHGTGSDFARSLDLPADPVEALDHLREPPVAIDVGRITFTDEEGGTERRHFLNVAGFGASGEVARLVNRSSKRLGGLSYLLASTRVIVAGCSPEVELVFDDAPPEVARVQTVFVCNGRFSGGGMVPGPVADLSDGLLDVGMIRAMSRVRTLLAARFLYNGKLLSHPAVRHARVRKLVARPRGGQRVPVDFDGEQSGRLPATFEVLPGVLPLRGAKRPDPGSGEEHAS